MAPKGSLKGTTTMLAPATLNTKKQKRRQNPMALRHLEAALSPAPTSRQELWAKLTANVQLARDDRMHISDPRQGNQRSPRALIWVIGREVMPQRDCSYFSGTWISGFKPCDALIYRAALFPPLPAKSCNQSCPHCLAAGSGVKSSTLVLHNLCSWQRSLPSCQLGCGGCVKNVAFKDPRAWSRLVPHFKGAAKQKKRGNP